MNFMPGWFPGAAAAGGAAGGAAPVSSMTHHATATSTAASVTGPSTIQSGDLLVYFDSTVDVFTTVTETAPAGFTLALGVNMSAGKSRLVWSYKVADGSEASASITGMTGAGAPVYAKFLLVFRPDNPIVGASHHDTDSVITDANPAAQTITSGSGTPPLVALGGYFSSGAINPRTFTVGGSPAKDGEESNGTNRWVAWKIYNSSPADVVVDMNDHGNGNCLMSLYIQVS